MAKAKNEVVKVKKAKGFDIHTYMNKVLDDVAKKMADADTIEDVQPMSTGSAVVDIMLGGGLYPSFYVSAGWEQSAKTTLGLLMMASAIKKKVPLISLRDAEGSTRASIPYVSSILRTQDIDMSREQLFGKRDKKTGKWVVQPTVRYSSVTKGSTVFNWIVRMIKRTPDKKLLDGQWWYVYEDSKEFAELKEYADKTMPRKYGTGIYIPAPDGGLQGLIVIDSLANLNPDMKDEEEGDNSLALAARMFAKHFPRFKGSLASKKIAIVGINHLSAIPMAMYGPSEDEVGGKAIKRNSDVRLRLTSRAVKAAPLWPKPDAKKKNFESEPSWDGKGIDYYEYKHVRFAKNKLGGWADEGWLRIWKKDSQGVAHGIDPVFDTLSYLRQTGQLLGKGREKLELKIEGWTKPKSINWQTLKAWVLGDKDTKISICKKLKLEKPIDLRRVTFRQIEDGTAETLLKQQAEKAVKDGKAKGDDADGDDDDD